MRCVAKTKTGRRCKAHAMQDGARCMFHLEKNVKKRYNRKGQPRRRVRDDRHRSVRRR